jgi:phospholipid/cholesterol/gamma-HCH transport system substrate-binding protein
MPAPRRVRWAQIRIAVTAFTALLILGVLLSLMFQGRLFVQWEAVRVFVPDASGVGAGTPVRLNGIPVGEVESVRLSGEPDPNRRVELTLRIAAYHRQRIPSDSMVTITPQDIQGEQFVDIAQGDSAAIIPLGGELPFEAAPEVLRALDLKEFERRMREIDKLLQEIEQGRGAVGQMVRGTQLYRNMVASVARMEASLKAATGPQQALGQLLYGDTLHGEVLDRVRRIDDRLAAIERGEGAAGRMLRDPQRYEDLLRQTAGLRRQLADLNAGRGPGGRFVADEAQYEYWIRQLVRFTGTVDALAAGESGPGRLLVSEQPYEALEGMLREMQRFMEDFRGNPRRYMRMGIF